MRPNFCQLSIPIRLLTLIYFYFGFNRAKQIVFVLIQNLLPMPKKLRKYQPGNGSGQLVIETGGAIGGQFMHHDWPLPSQGGRAQFASIVGGTLGRAGPRGGVPNVYPIQGAPVVANSRFVLLQQKCLNIYKNSYFNFLTIFFEH